MVSAERWISHLDARHRVGISAALSIAVFLLLRRQVRFSTELLASWDVFAGSVLLLAWLTIFTTPRERLRFRAQSQDLSRTLIFLFVIVAACAGLFAVAFLLGTNKGEANRHLTGHLGITLLAVAFSWALVHTVFGLRYAHTFYGDRNAPHDPGHAGGLQFPDEDHPDYLDFAYFSFVIGMTFQVSDVEVTSRTMRKMVLLHSALSFGFNTIILALMINTVSGFL